MTHDEKIVLVIQAINHARAEKINQGTENAVRLYVTPENKLSQIGLKETHDIINELTGEYELPVFLTLSPFIDRPNQPSDLDYLYLFLDQYPLDEDFLSKIGRFLEELSYFDFLKVYDVLLDIKEKQEVAKNSYFEFSYASKKIRFPEIYSGIDENTYIEARKRAIHTLYDDEIIKTHEHGFGRTLAQNTVEISFSIIKFKRYFEKAKQIYQQIQKNRQNKQEPQEEGFETAYEIVYTKAREIIVNGSNKSFRLAKPNFNGENDIVFSYLDKHPNIVIDKKTLEKANGGKLTKSLPKMVEKLGFVGDLLRAFFSVSENDILFRNSITKGELLKLGIEELQLAKKSKKIKV